MYLKEGHDLTEEPFHNALWDPKLEVGILLYWRVLQAIRTHTLEALGILRDLIGTPEFTDEDLDLCFYEFRVIRSILCEASSSERDRQFLAEVCASLMFKNGVGIQYCDAGSFLSMLETDYRAFERWIHRKPLNSKLRLAIRRLLEGYGLGGKKNRDLVRAIERRIAAEVDAAQSLLQSDPLELGQWNPGADPRLGGWSPLELTARTVEMHN